LAQTNLEVLTVRAPRDGTVLQLNVREGEYAGLTPTEPLMILGDTGHLQIRADVDEQNAPLVVAGEPAVAFLKGDTQNPIPLRFVRIEPYVVPKRSLTGDSAERVDTRVLQIIFELDRPTTPLYVGQQMDVFMQRPASPAVAKNP
jgi:HlyD family secretion protein